MLFRAFPTRKAPKHLKEIGWKSYWVRDEICFALDGNRFIHGCFKNRIVRYIAYSRKTCLDVTSSVEKLNWMCTKPKKHKSTTKP